LAAAASLVAIGLALLALDIGRVRSRLGGTAAGPTVQSIAVLPLANLSGDPEQEFFADGVTEQLITDLAQLRSLRVISRTSAMRFKGSDKSVEEIAHELGVDAVLEGSVHRVADRVRVTAQLIAVRPERHLWAGTYERELRDVLDLQSEVARTVAAQVHLELTPAERALLDAQRRVDPEAHESYLRGRYLLERGGQSKAGREALERAIALDPAYAAPHAALADYWVFQLPPRDAMERARAQATRALEIDDATAEAHAALGLVHLYYDWDLVAAEREFRRAVDLDPGSAYVHGRYAEFCWAWG
jgi:TolB-like protein